MYPAGFRMNALDKCVRIGGFQLCKLPPVQHLLGNLHPFGGKRFQNIC